MKLNPKKYAFGISADRFIGFLINERRIKANPKKVKVVLDMLNAKIVKVV